MKFLQKILAFLEAFTKRHEPDIGPIPTPPKVTPHPVVNPVQTLTKIDLWCKAITIYEGAKTELNNPGDLRMGEFCKSQGAIGQDYRGFARFKTLQEGYQALKTLLIGACEGKFGHYDPKGDLVAFYAIYAPSSDSNNPVEYANFVAKFIGVKVEDPIKNLLS